MTAAVATASAPAPAAARARAGRAAYALMLRATWKGGVIWSAVFALTVASTVKGYAAAFPTPAARALLAVQFGGNRAFWALYGVPRALDTAAGFTAWRLGTFMAILAGVWMLLSATRLLRGEEDDGRWELLVSGAAPPSRLVLATAAALATWLAVAWVALTLAMVGLGLAASGSAAFAAGIVLTGAVFAGVGTLTSQLVPIRRRASGLAGVVLGLAFLVRVVADGTSGLDWLRWASPFGWGEQIRPFAGEQLGPLALLAVSAVAIEWAAVALQRRRDLGRGLLFADDSVRRRPLWLGSSGAFSIRRAAWPTVVWAASMGIFAFVLGLLTRGILDFARESEFTQGIGSRLGGATLLTPMGYLGFALTFTVLVAALYAGFRIAADREEEAASRLDNLLVRPVGRRTWLLQQALVAVGGAAAVALVAALLEWAGAESRGIAVSLPRLLEGGLNAVPAAVLFTGLGVLVMALLPRATAGLTLGAIAASYLVQFVGAILRAPGWVLDLSVFHHVPAVPAAAGDAVSTVALIGIGAAFALAAAWAFGRRDIVAA
jgi:ABC-2 type transport system permease protein